MIRLSDVILSIAAIVCLSPILLLLSVGVKVSSKGPVLYRQKRVGKNGKEFYMAKFRTMYTDADVKGGPLTLHHKDSRITSFGYFLRKYKLDELPQFFNVLMGNMSIVGPRPEVKKYVDLYSPEQRAVLCVLPGITDYASIQYSNESEVLSVQADPESYYIQHIMPEKLRLNQQYLGTPTLYNYYRVILLTINKMIF